MTTWVVLGASSSVARAFARAAAAAGHDLVLAGRDGEDLGRSAADLSVRFACAADVVPFDATDYHGHAAFAERIGRIEGEIAVALFFGVMHPQACVDADVALARRTIAVNYLGAVSVLAHLAPVLEARRGGRIVAVGSMAGVRGRLSNYVYGSAKAGLAAYLQGLRARLWRAGVPVTTVVAGFLDTAMTFGLPGMFLVATPEAAAARILAAAERGREVVYVPGFWRWIALALRLVPERLFKRLAI